MYELRDFIMNWYTNYITTQGHLNYITIMTIKFP